MGEVRHSAKQGTAFARVRGGAVTLMSVPLPGGKTRADALVTYIEQMIEERGLAPGDRIATKEDLRDQTALARATINEAVRLLQNRGRVTLRPGPGGGLFVALSSPLVRLGQTLLAVNNEARVTVSDALVVRDALEPLIAVDAARHRTRRDTVELRALVRDLGRSVAESQQFLAINWRLHERIARISPNGMLQAMYLGISRFVQDQAAISGRDHPHLPHFRELHEALVEAIADGDAERARSIAEQHGDQLDQLSRTNRH
jgi:DNA-binding FadR family transcriptional regulator